jgi:hypothetical protein
VVRNQLSALIQCRNLTADDSTRRTRLCGDTLALASRPSALVRGGAAAGGLGGTGSVNALGSLGGGRGGARIGGAAGGTAAPSSALEMAAASSAQIDLKNFGLTLSCRPGCARTRAPDGGVYAKFEGYPAVTLLHDGLAAHAGLHDGDVLISVNGRSPLSEDGALILNRSEKELTLMLEISRAGKRQKFTLKL